MSNPHNRQIVMLQSGSSCSSPSQRRHSRTSFLPRVASEFADHNQKLAKDRYRLVVMGSAKVGKTAIIKQFLYETFPEEHNPTVEELHKSEFDIKDIGLIGVEILDTSGSFPFPAMNRLAIASGDAFILVYAVDDKDSFEEVKRLKDLISQVKGLDSDSSNVPPVVIAGNKCDLDDQRVFSREMTELECIDWEVGFVECSAKQNENVVQIFQQLLLQAHLRGTLKAISQPNSKSSGHGSNRETRNQQRRRSSLPINDLFHHHMNLSNFRHHSTQRSPSRKRSSCALS
ncbi:GTP-binding protein Di-Ras2-like protein [Dinothrombium tinctorium]|uniref:GTP-binding protein Di-Ras2-like protein n=1 Tax=Dinothrombium tinctorium TaxID=1965070 RepID=A0A3S3SCS1_9ACAR|nr:GTP-binding protein Di-Ras2-like protein [Dinothrombium tinctorium]RWS15542.1 GTP-binding protein Di-Ras2-like protein [Dinothrombium tinctorium]